MEMPMCIIQVNQKGAEGELEQAFRKQSEAASIPNTR